MPTPRPRVAVILAAGKGTRMKSALPKVLHRAAGRPLLQWVVDAARAAGCARILIVVGHGAEKVRAEIAAYGETTDLVWVLQAEQRGTGHALAQAESEISGEATVLVLSGDVPLLQPSTLDALATAADAGWGAMTVAELAASRHARTGDRRSGGRLPGDRRVQGRDARAAGGPPDQRRDLRLPRAGRLRLPAEPDHEQRPGGALPDRRRDQRRGRRPSGAPDLSARSGRGAGGQRPHRARPRPSPADRPPSGGVDEGRRDDPGARADLDRARRGGRRGHHRPSRRLPAGRDRDRPRLRDPPGRLAARFDGGGRNNRRALQCSGRCGGRRGVPGGTLRPPPPCRPPAARARGWATSSRSRTPCSAKAPRRTISPTWETPRWATERTSAPASSPATTTARASIRPRSAPAPSSAATPCWWRPSRSAPAPPRRPGRSSPRTFPPERSRWAGCGRRTSKDGPAGCGASARKRSE